MIDKVDEKVEKSELKTINGESVLGEGDLRVGVKSVESLEALEKLDAEVGDIATIGIDGELVEIGIEDCFLSALFDENWDKFTIIKKVEPSSFTDDLEIALYFINEARKQLCVGVVDKELIYVEVFSSSVNYVDEDEFNQLLANSEYRLYWAYGDRTNVPVKLFTQAHSSADAYIKGDTWTRLLKEGDVTGEGANIVVDSELSETSENPVQNKVITAELINFGEQFADALLLKADASAVDTINTTLSEVLPTLAAKTYVNSEVAKKVDKVSGKQLSAEDFTSALKTKLEGLKNYDDTAINSAISSLQSQLNTLVSGNASDAINSFNEIIAFLDGVKDSESLDSIIASIEQQIASKQDKINDLDTIRANAAKGATALQSVPSEYITESELNAKNFATTFQVNAKQDSISDLATIRSNASLGATAIQKVKTINGESIEGEGNVEIFTKAMHDELVENMLENEEVYASAVNDINTRLVETNATIATEVSTRERLSNDVQSLTDRITSNEDVTATSYNELNTRIDNNYQYGETTYATKAELIEEITGMTNSIVENEEVIAATLNDLLARIDALVTRVEQLENV